MGHQSLQRGYHDDAAENGYVVTAWHSRHIHEVTNRNVIIRSESEKQHSRRTVVKLKAAYLTFVIPSPVVLARFAAIIKPSGD